MLPKANPTLLQLLFSFLRLGISSFGGPSMVVYIRNLAVKKKQWLEEETFDNGVALCQMIPGATAIQTAAYVGLKTRGAFGAMISFIGFGLPAFILMMIFAALYSFTSKIPMVVSAFSGLQTIIIAIVANATYTFGKNTLKDWKKFVIAFIAAVLFWFNIHPIFVILFSALAGFLIINPKPAKAAPDDTIQKLRFQLKPLLLLISLAFTGFVFLFIFNRPLFDLAILMFRIDLFAFGGGFATIPLMYHEFVEVRNWIDPSTFMNGIVLGQVTPGPIVITATFVGYIFKGILGGIIATISIFLPSFFMLVIIAPLFDRLKASKHFNKFISGILCSFVGLLFVVTIRFGIEVKWNIYYIILAVFAFVALLKKIDILWVVSIGLLISVLLFFLF
jgi:chromate transporter